jgi:TolA-binding protein
MGEVMDPAAAYSKDIPALPPCPGEQQELAAPGIQNGTPINGADLFMAQRQLSDRRTIGHLSLDSEHVRAAKVRCLAVALEHEAATYQRGDHNAQHGLQQQLQNMQQQLQEIQQGQQEVLGQFNQLNVKLQHAEARGRNGHAVEANAHLVALWSEAQVAPDAFPQTRGGLLQLNDNVMRDLLQAYGQQVPASTVDKRRALAEYIGVLGF